MPKIAGKLTIPKKFAFPKLSEVAGLYGYHITRILKEKHHSSTSMLSEEDEDEVRRCVKETLNEYFSKFRDRL